MNDWLNNLKVGNRVCRETRNFTNILTVLRLTKTQIVCKTSRGAEYKYYKKNGSLVGDTWAIDSISELTPDKYNKIVFMKKKFIINNIKVDSLTQEQVEEIYKVICNKKEE